MLRTRFLSCSTCARHFREGECHCPFCGTKVSCAAAPTDFRRSRAVVFAAGLGAAVAGAGCTMGAVAQPLYGGVIVPASDAGKDSDSDAPADAAQKDVDTETG